MKIERVRAEHVEYVPAQVLPGIIYVSEKYHTAVHLCCCGCGKRVITPLGPTDWRVVGSGSEVSIYPSIGNWSFPCESHYWVRAGRIIWAERWSAEQIAAGRDADLQRKDAYFEEKRRGHHTSFWSRVQEAWRKLWR